MENFKKYFHLYILVALFIANVFVWQEVLAQDNNVLTVAFLDVGQGDAIFIEAPNGNQILLDGGPNNAVLKELSRLMPFYDRSIDVIIASHPDRDHIGGLPAVVKRYNVGMAVETGVLNDTATYEEFESVIKEQSVEKILARRGMIIWLDDAAYLEILFPDRDVVGWDTNDASIIMRLYYGNISFMLTGDAPKKIEEYVESSMGGDIHSSVLKLGHHGSKTSSSEIFLAAVSPEYAIVSAGKNNSYGHPHKEVIDLVERFNIPILSTYDAGTIVFETDGDMLRKR